MGGFASFRVASGMPFSLFDMVHIYYGLLFCSPSSHTCMVYHEIQIFRFGTKNGKPADSLVKKHNYILQPVSGNAMYTKVRQNEYAESTQPLQKAAVNLDDVTLCLSKVHFIFPLHAL